jgi:ketosteroid isomerase-like protein
LRLELAPLASPAVASAALGFVQRRVRSLQHALDTVVVWRRFGDADAARAANLARVDSDHEPVTRCSNAFGDAFGIGERGLWCDQREFLAAEPADDVRVPALGAEHVREPAEQNVADVVSECVVDAFEEIQIDDQHAERPVVALESGEFGCTELEPGAPRMQLGQHVGTDQPREVIARVLEVAHLAGEPRLQFGGARSDLNAGAQFLGVDRFDHVVVGAGVEPGDEIGATGAPGEQQHVNARELRCPTNPSANLDAVEAGHHPIENREVWRGTGRQQLPGRCSVAGGNDLDAHLLERAAQNGRRNRIVVGNQRPHEDRSSKPDARGRSVKPRAVEHAAARAMCANCRGCADTVIGNRLSLWGKLIRMKTATMQAVHTALAAIAVAAPIVCFAATPQTAVDELLAADRAFSAASANTDLISGLTAMFAEDVIIPNPPGRFAEGKAAVVAMLRANADNIRSRTEWTPVRGGIAADAQHGFTVGFMTLYRPDGATLPLKYLAYWVKRPGGWRVVVYKRARAGEGAPSLAMMPPALPAALVRPAADQATVIGHRASLDRAERAFSDEAQQVGLGPAFVKFGSADAVNLGGPGDANLVVGPENIARIVSSGQPPTGSTLNWAPDRVIVASSGDLGVTIGMIHPNAATTGQPTDFPFFTIWRRSGIDAPWRYVAE